MPVFLSMIMIMIPPSCLQLRRLTMIAAAASAAANNRRRRAALRPQAAVGRRHRPNWILNLAAQFCLWVCDNIYTATAVFAVIAAAAARPTRYRARLRGKVNRRSLVGVNRRTFRFWRRLVAASTAAAAGWWMLGVRHHGGCGAALHAAAFGGPRFGLFGQG